MNHQLKAHDESSWSLALNQILDLSLSLSKVARIFPTQIHHILPHPGLVEWRHTTALYSSSDWTEAFTSTLTR